MIPVIKKSHFEFVCEDRRSEKPHEEQVDLHTYREDTPSKAERDFLGGSSVSPELIEDGLDVKAMEATKPGGTYETSDW
jgi:hypothetical protein